MKSKTREELLKSTIEFYNSENRAVSDIGGCYYRKAFPGEKGYRKCAIGREISDELAHKLDDSNDGSVQEDKTFNKLPKRLKNMGQDFLHAVQLLHDSEEYWNKEGLSPMGVIKTSNIIAKYNLNMKI